MSRMLFSTRPHFLCRFFFSLSFSSSFAFYFGCSHPFHFIFISFHFLLMNFTKKPVVALLHRFLDDDLYRLYIMLRMTNRLNERCSSFFSVKKKTRNSRGSLSHGTRPWERKLTTMTIDENDGRVRFTGTGNIVSVWSVIAVSERVRSFSYE